MYLEALVDAQAELGSDAVFWHELIGVTVRGLDGRELGKVAEVYRVGENEVYVVRGGPVGEFDVPAVRDLIRRFAPREGEIVVDEVVLDLDAPPVDSRPAAPRRKPRWSRHGKGGAAGVSSGGSAPDPTQTDPASEPEGTGG